jgi:hypothetical protein
MVKDATLILCEAHRFQVKGRSRRRPFLQEGSKPSQGRFDRPSFSTMSAEGVVNMINKAKLAREPSLALELLSNVWEIIFRKEQNLLQAYFFELLQFETDPHVAIKKFVVGIIEDLFKEQIANMCIYYLSTILIERYTSLSSNTLQTHS